MSVCAYDYGEISSSLSHPCYAVLPSRGTALGRKTSHRRRRRGVCDLTIGTTQGHSACNAAPPPPCFRPHARHISWSHHQHGTGQQWAVVRLDTLNLVPAANQRNVMCCCAAVQNPKDDFASARPVFQALAPLLLICSSAKDDFPSFLAFLGDQKALFFFTVCNSDHGSRSDHSSHPCQPRCHLAILQEPSRWLAKRI